MITFDEVKEMFKKSIDATDTMNQALENLIQSIYLKGYNEALAQEPCIEEQRTEQYYGKELPSCNDLWIPTKERRPEMYGRYLCCFEDGHITTIFFYRGEFLIEDWEPIAWMELPMPYKEVETDDK